MMTCPLKLCPVTGACALFTLGLGGSAHVFTNTVNDGRI